MKTAKSIKMPFGLRIWVGPVNHVLDGSSDFPIGRDNYKWERAAHCKV